MIPFASQRGGGQDLATHLQNEYDNELMEVVEIRGAVARDLHGAFKEWEVQAETLTRCRKYLYSMSINPDPAQGELTREQYADYIARAEKALGLAEQPRAIVFHSKYGREHCHVVWSRIDAEHQKAVHIAFDRETLMQVTREFARENFLDLPAGYDKSRRKGQDSLYERAQKNETGLSKEDHKQRVTEAWRHSDDAKSFVHALAERGYILARGKRPYVLVDLYGGTHALSKLIDDKDVKTKDIRAFLEKDFPEDSLPTVEEAEELVEKHRSSIERSQADERISNTVAELKHAQRLRRLAVEQEAEALWRRQQLDRERLVLAQRDERHEMRRQHVARMDSVRARRQETRSTGLGAFLGRVTGVSAIRRTVHRYQDGKLIAEQKVQRLQLRKRQEGQTAELAESQKRRMAAMDRKERALKKIEDRELASLKRVAKREQRTRARSPDNDIPSLEKVAGFVERDVVREPPDLLLAFAKARDHEPVKPLDVLMAFNKTSRNQDNLQGGSGRTAETQNDPEIDSLSRRKR